MLSVFDVRTGRELWRHGTPGAHEPGTHVAGLVQPPGVTIWRMVSLPFRRCAIWGTSRLASGSWSSKVKPVIERVLPLAEAETAFTESRNRHVRGKLILSVVSAG